jgi:hypothetical protein
MNGIAPQKIINHSRCFYHTHSEEYVTIRPEKGLFKLSVVIFESRPLQNASGQFRQFQRYHNESSSLRNTSDQTPETVEGGNIQAGTRGDTMVRTESPLPANSEEFV